MLVMIERYPETKKIETLVTPEQYRSIAARMESTACPVLVDLENGIMKPVRMDYTGRSYNLVFR